MTAGTIIVFAVFVVMVIVILVGSVVTAVLAGLWWCLRAMRNTVCRHCRMPMRPDGGAVRADEALPIRHRPGLCWNCKTPVDSTDRSNLSQRQE